MNLVLAIICGGIVLIGAAAILAQWLIDIMDDDE